MRTALMDQRAAEYGGEGQKPEPAKPKPADVPKDAPKDGTTDGVKPEK